MSPRYASSNSGSRRYEDASAKFERGAPTRPPMEQPKPQKASGVPQRVLPPPTQNSAGQVRVAHYQTDPVAPQLPLPRRSLNTAQPGTAASSNPPLLPDIAYQYRPALPPTQGATTLLQNSYVAYPRENIASTNQRPVNGYTSIYNGSTQSTHREDRLQSQGVAIGYNSRETHLNEPSTPQASSVTAAIAVRPSTSQVRQPISALGQPQISQPKISSEDITSRYELRVRQQPVAARACGFGERDRRVLDPPPIVQLLLADYDPNRASDVSELKCPYLVVHCTLLSASPMGRDGQDVTAVAEPNNAGKLTRKMTGTLAASAFAATDPDIPASPNQNARLGCFFIFSDLSCRQVGRYRLKFKIMKVGSEHMVPGSSVPVLRSVESAEFEVYSAKDFPGMKASTPLIIDLKRQGALVSVKKGIEARSIGNRPRKGGSSTSDGNESSTSARASASNASHEQ